MTLQRLALAVPLEMTAARGDLRPARDGTTLVRISHRKATTLERSPSHLREHSLSALIPLMRYDEYVALLEDIRMRGIIEPLAILENGSVLDGRHRLRAARQLKLPTVPVRIVSDEDTSDPEGYIIRTAVLRRHLTDDQRAIIAREWQRRRSKQLQSDAGKTAAAIRDGKIDLRTYLKSTVRDSRAEACAILKIPVNRFLLVKKLEKANSSLVKKVFEGKLGLRDALRESRKRDIRRVRRQRQKSAEGLPPIANMLLGDCRTVTPTLPDRRFRLLLTDSPWGLSWQQPCRIASDPEPILNDQDFDTAITTFNEMLDVVEPKMTEQCRIMIFVPWRFEPEFRRSIERHGYRIRGSIVAIRNAPSFSPGCILMSQHGRIIYAARGNPKLNSCVPDVIDYRRAKQTDHPCEGNLSLLRQLIEWTTDAGDWVLDPFAGTGSTVVAVVELNRMAIGIEQDRGYYAQARARLRPNTSVPAKFANPVSC